MPTFYYLQDFALMWHTPVPDLSSAVHSKMAWHIVSIRSLGMSLAVVNDEKVSPMIIIFCLDWHNISQARPWPGDVEGIDVE